MLEEAIAVFNRALVAELAEHAEGLEEVRIGPACAPHILLQGRLTAVTVDDAWGRAVRISEAATTVAWTALRVHLRANPAEFGWHGPGIEVCPLRSPAEGEDAFDRRRRTRPTVRALPRRAERSERD